MQISFHLKIISPSSLNLYNVLYLFTAELIDENKLKEEEVRETLEKMDPNNIVNVDEITTKISEIAKQSKATIEELKSRSDEVIAAAKSSSSVLQKPVEQPDLTEEEEMAKHEDIINFYN